MPPQDVAACFFRPVRFIKKEFPRSYPHVFPARAGAGILRILHDTGLKIDTPRMGRRGKQGLCNSSIWKCLSGSRGEFRTGWEKRGAPCEMPPFQ